MSVPPLNSLAAEASQVVVDEIELRIKAHEGLSEAIDRVCEDVPAFQLRRIADIIRSASEAGDVLTLADIRQRSGIPDFDLLHRLVDACRDSPYAHAVAERVWQLVAGPARISSVSKLSDAEG